MLCQFLCHYLFCQLLTAVLNVGSNHSFTYDICGHPPYLYKWQLYSLTTLHIRQFPIHSSFTHETFSQPPYLHTRHSNVWRVMKNVLVEENLWNQMLNGVFKRFGGGVYVPSCMWLCGGGGAGRRFRVSVQDWLSKCSLIPFIKNVFVLSFLNTFSLRFVYLLGFPFFVISKLPSFLIYIN